MDKKHEGKTVRDKYNIVNFCKFILEANRTNQCNPLHELSGPGHQSGYTGSGTTADLNNHSNQMNRNYGTGYSKVELRYPTYKTVILFPVNGGEKITYDEKL